MNPDASAANGMRVLLVKTSSLGDLIHTLPALSDAQAMLPGVRIDWLLEEAFVEIAGWHPAVGRAVPVALRRWRRAPSRAWRSGEWRAFRADLAQCRYELVIDAQGLLKSAFLARLVPARRGGYDRASAREALATLAYGQPLAVPRALHAIERTRRLFAGLLGYALPAGACDYGLDTARFPAPGCVVEARSLLFLHGSARVAKCWPEANWRTLCARANAEGCPVLLPWGSTAERERAQRIAAGQPRAIVLPALGLSQIAALTRAAAGAVAVDTGLGHLAAALGTPCVSLYGPTDPARVGTVGAAQRHLVARNGDLRELSSQFVWQELAQVIAP